MSKKKGSGGQKSAQASHAVILIGFPGCGKSTFAKLLGPSVVVCSSDELGSKEQRKLAEKCARTGKTPLIDSCNVHPKDRAMWASLLPQQRLLVIWLNTPLQQCAERAKGRKGHPTLPPEKVDEVLGRFAKGFKPPTDHERRKYQLFLEVAPGGDKEAAKAVLAELQK